MRSLTMTSSATSFVRCDDGTETPVDWVYPDAAQGEWLWNRAHWVEPATALDHWLRLNGGPGADRAWDEAGLVAPAMFYRFQFAGPFSYIRMDPDEPAWTPLFGVAGAIVTETGGVLSHPAITAREYGVPALLAVQDATERIRDGQLVTVDGGAGIVTLHD
jgi:hypothetical protein